MSDSIKYIVITDDTNCYYTEDLDPDTIEAWEDGCIIVIKILPDWIGGLVDIKNSNTNLMEWKPLPVWDRNEHL